MKTILKLPVIIVLSMAGLLLSGCDQSGPNQTETTVVGLSPADSGNIANTELQARILAGTAPVILDVRSADEYADGHIAGALNIEHTDVVTRITELPADRTTEIVVHCHSGRRAAIAKTALQEAGYTNIRHLEGDYIGWDEAGLPLE